MNYKLRFGNRALKDLRKLDHQISKRILDRIEDLKTDLTGDVKKLTDYSPKNRLRVGDFRVLFDVESDTIQIQRILNRREAYLDMATFELHPEFLSRKGKRQFAVIPYDEFLRLQEWIEDARDLLDLELAIIENKEQPTYSLEEVKQDLGISDKHGSFDHPRCAE